MSWVRTEATVILVEPHAALLSTLRGALMDRGLSLELATTSLEEMVEATRERLCDLIICDGDQDPARFCRYMHDVRHGERGPNPYMTVIATTGEASVVKINRIIASGIDHILLRPYSLAALAERIDNLVHHRKPFVVSEVYIGPDRRVISRAEVGLPLIVVPNSLRDRMIGTYDESRLLAAIAETRSAIELQRKIQSTAVLPLILDQVLDHYRRGGKDGDVAPKLRHFHGTARDLAKRLRKTGQDHIAQLCETLVPVILKVSESHGEPLPKDLRLMEELTQAVQVACGRNEAALDFSDNVASSVQSTGRFSAP